MEHRLLSRLDRSVSVVGLGVRQLGGDWGEVSDSQALATLNATTEAGTDFIDTADAANAAQLNDEQMGVVKDVYERLIRPLVHDRW